MHQFLTDLLSDVVYLDGWPSWTAVHATGCCEVPGQNQQTKASIVEEFNLLQIMNACSYSSIIASQEQLFI